MIVIPNVSGVVGARCDQFNVISNSSRESSPSVKQYKLLMFSPDVPKNLIIIFVIYKTKCRHTYAYLTPSILQ